MTRLAEASRRLAGAATGRLRSLPILALEAHSACNCRCVMCDIWKANAEKREIDDRTLAGHVDAIRRLRVQRVMLTGGEPLLHRNLWALADRIRAEGIRITLVTTGLLLDAHAAAVARACDTVVVSVDGPPEVHDAVRRTPRGFERIARGIRAVREAGGPREELIVRSVVQRANFRVLDQTVAAVAALEIDRLSFLPADVSSTAFNRAVPWEAARQASVALGTADLPAFREAIDRAAAWLDDRGLHAFVAGGRAGLERLHAYYAAVNGVGPWPEVRCNAPWISAVLQADGAVRPCFFHPPYPAEDGPLDGTINGPGAIRFRRALRVAADPTCRRCVCSLALPLTADA